MVSKRKKTNKVLFSVFKENLPLEALLEELIIRD
jgi:hypothetical protein